MRALSVVVVLVLAVGLPAAAAAWPANPVLAQVRWIADASSRPPVSDEEARQHVSARFLDQVGGTAGINSMIGAAGPLRLESLRPQHLREQTHGFALFAAAGRPWHAVVVVDQQGLIDHLVLSAVPTSWPELDDRLRALAPRVSMLAAEIDRHGRCHPRHELDADTAQPVGSAFKLYVLGALAHAVNEGTATWDEPLAVHDEWKAGPGMVGSMPAGTVLPLREYADHMMFYSDNSATDHLIHRLHRGAVQAQQARFGMRAPNVPFLTAREFFQLKAIDYPVHADAYLALDRDERVRYADEVLGPLPMPTQLWQQPRNIDGIEWFASPADICRAFAGLRAQRQEPVGAALSPQGTTELGLDQTRWPVGWFKGGAEPGVLSRSYLATTDDGRVLVVSLMINDPRASVNDAHRAAELLALGSGAFELLR